MASLFMLDNRTGYDFDLSTNGSYIEPDSENSSECGYEKSEFLSERFVLITLFGSTVSVWGMLSNALLVLLFTRKNMIVSQFFYLAVLAAFDFLICVCYLFLFSFQILYDYLESEQLYYAWNSYLRPLYAVSHISMTMSTYMIVSASAERYMTTAHLLRRSCQPRDRTMIVLAVFIFCFFSKGVVFWEIDVVYNDHCEGFEKFHLTPSSLARYPPYQQFYVLWFRHIVHVFLPFVSLICLNSAIVYKLKRKGQLRDQRMTLRPPVMECEVRSHTASQQRKKNIRQATRTMVVLISTYLVSNVLNIVVTGLENFHRSFLFENSDFYLFAVDVVSLLTVLTIAMRLPTYYIFNAQVRTEIHYLYNRMFSRKKYKNDLIILITTV